MSLTPIFEKIASEISSLTRPSTNPNIELIPESQTCSEKTPHRGVSTIDFLPKAKALVELTPQGLLRGLVHRAGIFLDSPELVPMQTCCSLKVSSTSIAFGSVKLNTGPRTQDFTISNPHCCSVSYIISGVPLDFTVSSSSGSISPNSSVTITVTFRPTREGGYSGSLSISPSGTPSVSITATGVK